MRWVVDACRSVLGERREASVAYMPMASLRAEKWLKQTEKAFQNLARIELINTETMELSEMEGIVRRAALAYLPGGNTFLLNHRLHVSRLMPYLRKKIRSGLPVVAFSAGAIACGPNILTTLDLNMVPTPHFDGLQATPFNIHAHYVDEAPRDEWLAEYHSFHDNAILMLEDGAYVRITGKETTLVRGPAWLWRAGREKEKLSDGQSIPVQ
jgi:peptidase E